MILVYPPPNSIVLSIQMSSVARKCEEKVAKLKKHTIDLHQINFGIQKAIYQSRNIYDQNQFKTVASFS